jgi:hypothetical protein
MIVFLSFLKNLEAATLPGLPFVFSNAVAASFQLAEGVLYPLIVSRQVDVPPAEKTKFRHRTDEDATQAVCTHRNMAMKKRITPARK